MQSDKIYLASSVQIPSLRRLTADLVDRPFDVIRQHGGPIENHTPTAECAPPVSMFVVYNSMPLSVKSEVWNYGSSSRQHHTP